MSKIIFFDKTNHYHFAEFKVHQRRKQTKLCDGNCWFVDPKFVKTCYQLANKWLEILKVSHYSKHICTLMSEWLVVLTECRLLPAMPDSSPATDFDIRSSFLKLWRGLRSRFTLSFHNVTHLLYAFTFCPYARLLTPSTNLHLSSDLIARCCCDVGAVFTKDWNSIDHFSWFRGKNQEISILQKAPLTSDVV